MTTQTNGDELERQKFEEWFMNTYPKSRNGIRTWSGKKDGDYISDYAASHWRAWQVALNSKQEEK